MTVFVLFILILSLLVIIHEFGHFIAARKNGVFVEEFGFGLPPRVVGKKVGDTIYSLNLLPFGGFVKLKGEDPSESSDSAAVDPENFMSKTPWRRAGILVAGIVMNLMLGVFLYYVLFFFNGFRTLTIPLLFDDFKFPFGQTESINTVVTSYMEGSPAERYGINTGEAVLEIDGIAVYSVADVRTSLEGKEGEEVKILLMDLRKPSKPLRTISAIPTVDEEGRVILGVILSKALTISYNTPVQKSASGFMHSYNMLAYTGYVFNRLIGISFEERTITPVSSSVSGPVGIYSVIGGILDYAGDKAYLAIIDLVALMSLSLAVINLLPFPALDGGRLVFVLAEGATGKKVNPAVEANIHRLGMFFLLSLIVLITIKDVLRIFG